MKDRTWLIDNLPIWSFLNLPTNDDVLVSNYSAVENRNNPNFIYLQDNELYGFLQIQKLKHTWWENIALENKQLHLIFLPWSNFFHFIITKSFAFLDTKSPCLLLKPDDLPKYFGKRLSCQGVAHVEILVQYQYFSVSVYLKNKINYHVKELLVLKSLSHNNFFLCLSIWRTKSVTSIGLNDIMHGIHIINSWQLFTQMEDYLVN